MQYYYLLINLGAILVPLIFSFHPKYQFYKTWRAFWPATLISAIPFIGWDMIYAHYEIWGFNPNYLTGIYLFNLPIEEWLFFICIPYACVFTWHSLGILMGAHSFKAIGSGISIFLIAVLLLGAIVFHSRLYTVVTFGLLSILIIFLRYYFKIKWLKQFYFTYAVLLIPFGIVNGLLTGFGLEAPIVWYNNSEIIGLRLLTIPVEDVFYGMMLILLNAFLYEYFKRRFRDKATNSGLSV